MSCLPIEVWTQLPATLTSPPCRSPAYSEGYIIHAIVCAAIGGRLDVVRYLCELRADRGVDPAGNNNNAIRTAAGGGHLHVVRYLCELPADRGVDPAGNNNGAIREAAGRGHLHVVRYLCELPADRGVDPAAGNNDAIRTAACHGRLDVVRYLCELPANRGVRPARHSCCGLPRYLAGVVRYLYGANFTSAEYFRCNKRWHQKKCWRTTTWRRAARSPLISLCAILRSHSRAFITVPSSSVSRQTTYRRQSRCNMV